ncbi:MAG: hypothetical protein AAGG56_17200 [Pseudomonadota bacterium]
MYFAELLKFLGVVLSAAVAIYATRTDHMKTSDASGKLTGKGWTIVTLAIVGVLISGGAQVFQIADVLESSRKNQERQAFLTSRLENITYQAVRQYYPLEPVTFVFVLEYPMDQPYLSEFAEELRGKIHAYLVAQREGRKETDPLLTDEDVIFRLSSMEDWLPTDREAHFNLLEDSTTLSFVDGPDAKDLRFLSAPEGYEKIIIARPTDEVPSQEITLFADFTRRVFLKEVVSKNPLRMGDDLASVSALDLVFSEMTWDAGSSIMPDDANSGWRLSRFGFIFPFDFDQGSTSLLINSVRAFDLFEDQTSHSVTPANVGLQDVFDELGLKPGG